MNKRESNKLTMFESVISYMDVNSAITAAIPVVGETVTQLKTEVEELKAMDLEFVGRTIAETTDKRLKEEALISAIFKIASALFVLGVKTKNTELMVKNKVSKSGLDYLREPLLVNKCTEILIMGNANKDALVNYGISDAMLIEAQGALDAFQTAIAKQSDTHVNSVAEREALNGKFSSISSLLSDELDPMIELFEDSDPLFYDGYQNARMIKDLGIRHVSTPLNTGA